MFRKLIGILCSIFIVFTVTVQANELDIECCYHNDDGFISVFDVDVCRSVFRNEPFRGLSRVVAAPLMALPFSYSSVIQSPEFTERLLSEVSVEFSDWSLFNERMARCSHKNMQIITLNEIHIFDTIYGACTEVEWNFFMFCKDCFRKSDNMMLLRIGCPPEKCYVLASLSERY